MNHQGTAARTAPVVSSSVTDLKESTPAVEMLFSTVSNLPTLDQGKMDPRHGSVGKKELGALEPEELTSLLGNLIASHRAGMGYEETKKKLTANQDVERSTSGFTSIHHSFWDVLKDDLSRNPSDMGLAANLLIDIKSRVLTLFTPTTRGLQVELERLLDDEILNARAGKGPIRLRACGTGVLLILEKICIPHREEEIRQLVKEKNLLAMYKGIIRTTDKMMIDRRRFNKHPGKTLREDSDDETVDKVADYMYHLGGELPVTEAWLKKYYEPQLTTRDIMCRAFVGLLASGPEQYPETLMMHVPRLEDLKKDYFQLIIAVSVVLTSLAYLPPEMCTMESRENCFTMAMILLKGVKSDQELARILPNVIDQMRISLSRKLREMSNMSLTESHMKAISYQLKRLPDPHQKVRRSVTARVQAHLLEVLKTEGSAPVPDILHFISRELVELSAKLNLIFADNLDKCMVFYSNILNNLSRKNTKVVESTKARNARKQQQPFKYIRTRPHPKHE